MGRVEYRVAETEADREAIFRLRHECYTREGFIEPHPSGLFSDAYDEAPNCLMFGLYLEERIVASIRVHAATRNCPVAPGVAIFNDLLGPRLERGQVIVDSTRFVVDLAASREHPGLAYLTARTGFMALEHYKADLALAGCRKEHRAFYKRVFCMDMLGEPRVYPSLTRPITLMVMDYPAAKERIIARYPFMASSKVERDFLFNRPAHAPATAPLAAEHLDEGLQPQPQGNEAAAAA